MTRVAALALLLAHLLLAVPVYGDGEEYTILTENAPPTNYLDKNSQLVGSSVEVVREIMQRLDWSNAIEVYPWVRAYAMALQEPKVALFSTTRTAEREPLFKWVGPLYKQCQSLYKAASSELQIEALEDARKVKSIGTYYNDAAEQYLKQHGFTNLESAPDDQLNIGKLVLGRIQLWATGDAGLSQRIEEAGYPPEAIEEAFVLQTIELYIAFSLDTPDEVIARWQQALDDMKQESLYERILQKYRTALPER